MTSAKKITTDKVETPQPAAEQKKGPQSTGRRPPGAKEVIPFVFKLVGEAQGVALTLFKSIEQPDADAQLERVRREGYYGNLRILGIDEKVKQPAGAKARIAAATVTKPETAKGKSGGKTTKKKDAKKSNVVTVTRLTAKPVKLAEAKTPSKTGKAARAAKTTKVTKKTKTAKPAKKARSPKDTKAAKATRTSKATKTVKTAKAKVRAKAEVKAKTKVKTTAKAKKKSTTAKATRKRTAKKKK